MLLCVPCQGTSSSPVEIRAGYLSLQPETLRADQEATNGLKHSEKRLRNGSQWSMRAVTRVNVEQAPKRGAVEADSP